MRIVTLSQLSLAGSSGIAEAKIPLWWADGNGGGGTATATYSWLADGTNALNATTGSATSANKLFTLSSNCPASQRYALEATIWISGSNTVNAELWDITAGSAVSGSAISTTSTTATLVRSGQFTLTPGHTYGVAIASTNGSYTSYYSDASLIIFP